MLYPSLDRSGRHLQLAISLCREQSDFTCQLHYGWLFFGALYNGQSPFSFGLPRCSRLEQPTKWSYWRAYDQLQQLPVASSRKKVEANVLQQSIEWRVFQINTNKLTDMIGIVYCKWPQPAILFFCHDERILAYNYRCIASATALTTTRRQVAILSAKRGMANLWRARRNVKYTKSGSIICQSLWGAINKFIDAMPTWTF